MADEIQNGAPSTVTTPQAGDNAFGKPAEGVVANPALPQDGAQKTLDEILAAVRGTAQPPKAEEAKPVTEAKPVVETPDKADPAASVKPTGNKALDIAVATFVKSAGATDGDISKALDKAYESGNVADIDRAFLKERFGDNAESAIALAEAVMEHELAASQSILNSVFEVAGGEAKFREASDVFRQHADADEKAAVRFMLDSNNPDMVKYAAKKIVDFHKASGVLSTTGGKLVPDSGFSENQGLSADEFTKARHALNQMSRTYQNDLGRLMELRRIGIQLGK